MRTYLTSGVFLPKTIELPSLELVNVNCSPNLKKFGLGTIKNSQLKLVILENESQVDIDTRSSYLLYLLVSSLLLKHYLSSKWKILT